MKKNTITIALAAVLLGIGAAQADEFSGGWVGGKAGSNRSDVTGIPSVSGKSTTTYGIEGGYNWDVSSFLLGVDGFADWNNKTTHAVPLTNYGSDVYGIDAKLGLPSGKWLPYAKLGYGHARATGAGLTGTGNGIHAGLGVEYKLASQWSLAGEYTTSKAKSGPNKLNNDNITIGINYYFAEPHAAPVVAPVAAPVVKEEPPKPPVVVAPPVPETIVEPPKVLPKISEVWKTLLEEKPVTLKGTNFDFDSARLRPSADKQLDEVVSFAAAYKDATLDVSGHTCSIGTDAYNQKLSQRRADSVKAYLVKKGVAASRIIAKGYGEKRPVADNKTKAGREQNRRVEIRSVIKEEKKVRVK